MRIFRLSSDHRFRSLHLLSAPAGDGSARIPPQWFAGCEPVGNRWVPPEVGYTHPPPDASVACCEAALDAAKDPSLSEMDLPLGDFPHCWGINFGVLSRKSTEALKMLIGPYVELLPMRSGDGDFTAFKVLRFVDALDTQHSLIDWEPRRAGQDASPWIVRQIRKYAFGQDKLENEVIFRVPQLSTGFKVFVTDIFVRAVTAHQLLGFQFQPVWPPPDDRERFLRKRSRNGH